MSANNHPAYKEELDYLKETLQYIESYNEILSHNKSLIDSEVDYGIKHYNSDNSEQFNELIINTTLQGNINERLNSLHKSKSKPYFARVDFLESSKKHIMPLYIGKISLLKDDQNFLVVDWRSPIATLYYEGRLGKASYECPEGTIDGNISLKRQYSIENSLLKEIYDIDITTNDDFLQAALGSNKDNRLKDIVSTIQAEQNRVIRAEPWKPLIVQGAAGGGKTTIALHRIAYLLYNYSSSLTSENIVIIAPNRFFLSYISDVLPELGVEKVKQSTFEALALDYLEQKVKIEDPTAKIVFLTSKVPNEFKEDLIKISNFKASLKFKTLIDLVLKDAEQSIYPEKDFSIHNHILISKGEIQRFFLSDYSYLPMGKRIGEIKKHLVNKLKENKNNILEEIEWDYDFKLNKLRHTMKDSPERRRLFIELTGERDELLKSVKNKSKTIIKEYINKFKLPSPSQLYNSIFTLESKDKYWSALGLDEIFDKSMKDFQRKLNSNIVDEEDLSPLMYIKYKLYGLEDKFHIKHVVIDEAQDYTPFQIYVLKLLLNTSCFTLLGDLSQGIYSFKAIKNWHHLAKEIFEEKEYNYMTLEQSYRTTIEIMDKANTVISALNNPDLPLAKPVIRHGKEVIFEEKLDYKHIAESIKKEIEYFDESSFKSLALICKDSDEAKVLNKELKKIGLNIEIINEKTKDYLGGIKIIPSYFVKGLEFDKVIIINASSEKYPNDELNTKLLYIAMTRSLHELIIYYIKEKSFLLQE